MTTDEVQQAGERRRPTTTDDDEFSSENYIERLDAASDDDSADTVILGAVHGEYAGADSSESAEGSDAESDTDADPDPDDTAPDEPDPGHTADSGDIDPAASDAAANPDSDNVGTEPDEVANHAATGTPDNDSTDEVADAGGPNGSGGNYLEMRQVAGLTAGSMMKLTVGRAFEFNESNEGGSFSLRVLENDEVAIHPGSAHAVIDEVEVNEPMLVGDAVLNVSSACFSVRRPRPPASRESRMESIGAAFASVSAIPVPAIGAEEPLAPDQMTGSRLGTIINRNPLTSGAVGLEAWNFLQSIRQARSVVAERHRLVHPDPEELKTRLSRLDPGLWERSRDHPLFGRFGIGYANIPWEPKFDNPELIPEILHEPIVEMSLLPWVPVTANLLYGPLGIVGKRAARLAACRHAILSMAALTVPGEVQFAIRSGKNTATSWNWARALPAIMSAQHDSPYVITIIDGADGARADETARQAAHEEAMELDSERSTDVDDDGIAIDPEPTGEVPVIGDGGIDQNAGEEGDDELDVLGSVQTLTPGYIVLAETLDELTQPCGTVLQIESDGTGSVTNHLNETIQVTPIGVTEPFAHDMATRIADILTNSFL